MDKNNRIIELEIQMSKDSFWNNKDEANKVLKEYKTLKQQKSPYKNSLAVLNVYSGSGGIDSEDFVKILVNMYIKFCERNKFNIYEIQKTENSYGGIKNISLLVDEKGSFELLKNESGVHRLVRISPFNTKKQRHTSFVLVDITPKIEKINSIEIDEKDLSITFTNSSGPGGQNVNKRETAVRILHIPTSISVRVENERSQLQNKERAMEILTGKLLFLMQKQQVDELKNLSKTSDKEISWGNQIRSYVMHPYKMVKDLRSGYETSNIDAILDGNLEEIINSTKDKI